MSDATSEVKADEKKKQTLSPKVLARQKLQGATSRLEGVTLRIQELTGRIPVIEAEVAELRKAYEEVAP